MGNDENAVIPHTPLTKDMLAVFASPKLERMRQAGYVVGTGTKNNKRKQVTTKSKQFAFDIWIENIDLLAGSNKSTQKIFITAFEHLHLNHVKDGRIVFSLESLQRAGICKSVRAARRIFIDAMDVITSIKIKGGSKKARVYKMAWLFSGSGIHENQCYITLNPDIDYTVFTEFLLTLPRFYYRLPARSSALLFYVSYLARQKHTRIKVQSVSDFLGLPAPEETKDSKRDIIEPIQKAVEEINQHAQEFKLNLVYPSTNVREFLREGYIEIVGRFPSLKEG